MELSKAEALRLALDCQLHRQEKLSGKTGVLELIRQLGYVQIDTISVVERAHHHTIWSRIEKYDKNWLDELLERDRAIFEFWGHAASYLPMEDFRYSLPRMRRFPDTTSWEREFFERYKHLFDNVRARVTAEGPLGAKDFPDTPGQKASSGWGTGKPEKIALELLLWKGELMVHRRDRFQRVYDLTERVIPAWVDTSYPSESELLAHYILRALAALGIATLSDLQTYFMQPSKNHFSFRLQELLEDGKITKVSVAGQQDEYYCLPEYLSAPAIGNKTSKRAYLLSPFDNLTILRPRLSRLFGFEYSLECYVPPQKRKYGYWCLPILYGDKFVGRLDCKANRAAGQMEVKSLHWENVFRQTPQFKKSLQRTFDSFAAFCGCSGTTLP